MRHYEHSLKNGTCRHCCATEIEIDGGVECLPKHPLMSPVKQQRLMTDPPANPVWGFFAGEKWDHEHARNVLLHFIHKHKLDKQCYKWLDENFTTMDD